MNTEAQGPKQVSYGLLATAVLKRVSFLPFINVESSTKWYKASFLFFFSVDGVFDVGTPCL